jgi:vitamin-K-epoxide reductase (warfarin-sensitive)
MTWKVLSSEFFAVLGAAVALYALYIEWRKEMDEGYEALCDTASFSCTKVLMSEYGHILSKWGLVAQGSRLDVPNPVLGLGFYGLVLARGALGLPRQLMLAAATGSFLFSLYLAGVLYFVLHDFCVVCVSSYLCNTAIFFFEFERGGGASAPRAKAKNA